MCPWRVCIWLENVLDNFDKFEPFTCHRVVVLWRSVQTGTSLWKEHSLISLEMSFLPGDLVWAKMRGHPHWLFYLTFTKVFTRATFFAIVIYVNVCGLVNFLSRLAFSKTNVIWKLADDISDNLILNWLWLDFDFESSCHGQFKNTGDFDRDFSSTNTCDGGWLTSVILPNIVFGNIVSKLTKSPSLGKEKSQADDTHQRENAQTSWVAMTHSVFFLFQIHEVIPNNKLPIFFFGTHETYEMLYYSKQWPANKCC